MKVYDNDDSQSEKLMIFWPCLLLYYRSIYCIQARDQSGKDAERTTTPKSSRRTARGVFNGFPCHVHLDAARSTGPALRLACKALCTTATEAETS